MRQAIQFLSGELTGQHDAVATGGPERFASPALDHAAKFTFRFTQPGEYEYLCTIHPYMKGRIRVVKTP